jgi:hypothetical protein
VRRRTTRLALAAVALCAFPAAALAYHVQHVGDAILARAWPARRLPVPFRMDRGIVENDPDLLSLVRDGAGAWNDVATSYASTHEVGWTTLATSLASVMGGTSLSLDDGMPEIAVDFDGDVYEFLGLDLAVVTGVGVTQVGSEGMITDGFVLLNGTLPLGRAGDVTREIVAHEAGHLFGLGHSGVTDRFIAEDGAVFPTMSGSTNAGIIAPDDVAVLSALYPECAFEATFGAIEGAIVRGDGTGTVGVQVTAVSLDGLVAVGHLSGTLDDQGSYHIAGLPPGDYHVYIEPLDGTQMGAGRTPERIDGLFATTPDTAFEVEAFGDVAPGGAAETIVTVEAGRTTTGVDFMLGLGGDPVPVVAIVDGAASVIPVAGQNNTLPLGGGPLAVIDVAATTVLVSTPVAFDGSGSRSCDGAITDWSWSFDDGTPGDVATAPSHTFAAVGTYDVVLTVTDAIGNSASHFQTMAVVTELPPEPEPPGCGCRVARKAPGGTLGMISLALALCGARRVRRFVSSRAR